MSDLFGGGETKIANVPTLTGGQQNLLSLIVNQLASQFRGGQLQGLTPFQGIRPAEVPFGPLQQQGFGLAGGLAPGIGAGLDLFSQTLGQFDPTQGQGLLGQAQGALQQGLDFDPTQDILQAFEPSRQLARRGFEETTTPFLLERFGATSGPSGPLNRALAEAGAGLELGLSAQTAPFIGQAALQQPGLQLQGAGLGGQLAGVPGQLALQGGQLGGMSAELLDQLLNIGGLQQQLPRGVAASEQARFLEAQPFANQLFASLIGPGLGTPAFQNIGVQQPQGILTPALAGLGAFAGSGGFGGLGNIFGNIGGFLGSTFGRGGIFTGPV